MTKLQSEFDIQAALARVESCLGEERPRDAVADLQAVLTAVPNHPMALCGVGRVSIQLGDNQAALQVLDMALAVAPDLAEVRNARGAALQNLGRLDEAEAEFRYLVDALPDHPGPLVNLAATLATRGEVGAAGAAFEKVLALKPGDFTASYNLGLLRLLRGDLEAGWQGFEFRDRASNVGLARIRSAKPRWQGEAEPDKTLLVHAEQGLGDNIQFARFLPMAAERVGRVILEMPGPLTGLFSKFPGADHIIPRDGPLPAHDLHIPIMSLPAVLRIPGGEIPWSGPYIAADADVTRRWRERMEQRAPGMVHVGLIWSGNPAHKRDAERSVPLSLLEPLLKVSGVCFHSLQIGAAAEQIPHTAFSGPLKLLFRRAYPFTEVAAAVAALDLVIGVDTALVHLAGAMDRPVWTMITRVPDWRWMLERSDTPWYPSMQLFRQPAAGDWPSVVENVVVRLQELVAGRAGP